MAVRVLFVVPDLAVGGAERHLVSLVTTMDRDRCAPSVVCLGQEGALFGELVAAGVPCRALHRRKIDGARALADLLRLMRRDAPDLVVTRGYSAEALGRIAALLLGIPAMVWVHHSANLVGRTRTRQALDRVLTPRSAAALGLVESQRPFLAELGWRPDQVVIVPPGVTPRPQLRPREDVRVELGVPHDAELIVAIARLSPEKDLATLLHAMVRARSERPLAQLVVVGDGPLRSELEACTRAAGVDDAVVFTGGRPDVGDILGAADVAALSSISECAPLAVLEAMAAGVPVVATAVGGVPELLAEGDVGVLVPPHDQAALSRALVGLLADPVRRAELGRLGRTRVQERHLWSVVTPCVEDVLVTRWLLSVDLIGHSSRRRPF